MKFILLCGLAIVSTASAQHALGWKEDRQGRADKSIVHSLKFGAARILPASDLRAKMPPVVDQGQVSSCTGCATAAALDYAHAQAKVMFFEPSRLFLYYGGRALERSTMTDDGAMIRDVVATALRQGAPPERTWPYAPNRVTTVPNPTAYRQALQYQAITAYKLDNRNSAQIRQALSAGMPVIFGVLLFDQINRITPAAYTLALPRTGQRSMGGHAMLIVGHDDARQLYTIRNSWGAAWGHDGYFLAPYSYIEGKLASDFWVISSAE